MSRGHHMTSWGLDYSKARYSSSHMSKSELRLVMNIIGPYQDISKYLHAIYMPAYTCPDILQMAFST